MPLWCDAFRLCGAMHAVCPGVLAEPGMSITALEDLSRHLAKHCGAEIKHVGGNILIPQYNLHWKSSDGLSLVWVEPGRECGLSSVCYTIRACHVDPVQAKWLVGCDLQKNTHVLIHFVPTMSPGCPGASRSLLGALVTSWVPSA